MISTTETTMQYLAAYALVFTAGLVVANLWRLHGHYMHEAVRRDMDANVMRRPINDI